MKLTPSHKEIYVEQQEVFSFRFTPDRDMPVGSQIYLPFYLKSFENFMDGVDEDWTYNSLITCERSDGGDIKGFNVVTNPEFLIVSDYILEIKDNPLERGESITITFGNRDHKLFLTRKQLNLRLECLYRESGEADFRKVDVSPIKVLPLPPQSMYLLSPSVLKPKESGLAVIYFEDDHRNICDNLDGIVDLKLYRAGEVNCLKEFKVTLSDLTHKSALSRYELEFSLDEDGVYFIEGFYRSFSTKSNPVVISQNQQSVYWGDLHVHSQVSDGKGEVEDVIVDAYKRGWDFVAVADHSFGRDERGPRLERLKDLTQTIERLTIPRVFYPLFAGETHYLWYTHLNMYFRHNDPLKASKLLDQLDDVMSEREVDWEKLESDELEKLIRTYWNCFNRSLYGYRETLALFHHTMWYGNIGYMDDDIRLIEMASIFGSSETRSQIEESDLLKMQLDRIEGDADKKMSVREALDSGYKLGFVGGSDNHEGQAGTHAITAIRPEEFTREGLWDSLYNRNCYATSANRSLIYIDLTDRTLKANIYTPEEISSVAIIIDGVQVVSYKPVNSQVYDLEHTLDENFINYLYIRVVLKSGSTVWTTPYWSD